MELSTEDYKSSLNTLFLSKDYIAMIRNVQSLPLDKKNIILKHLNALDTLYIGERSDENRKYAYYFAVRKLIKIYKRWLPLQISISEQHRDRSIIQTAIEDMGRNRDIGLDISMSRGIKYMISVILDVNNPSEKIFRFAEALNNFRFE
jgi:hypothetical protein